MLCEGPDDRRCTAAGSAMRTVCHRRLEDLAPSWQTIPSYSGVVINHHRAIGDGVQFVSCTLVHTLAVLSHHLARFIPTISPVDAHAHRYEGWPGCRNQYCVCLSVYLVYAVDTRRKGALYNRMVNWLTFSRPTAKRHWQVRTVIRGSLHPLMVIMHQLHNVRYRASKQTVYRQNTDEISLPLIQSRKVIFLRQRTGYEWLHRLPFLFYVCSLFIIFLFYFFILLYVLRFYVLVF